jgi:hypothetical protein
VEIAERRHRPHRVHRLLGGQRLRRLLRVAAAHAVAVVVAAAAGMTTARVVVLSCRTMSRVERSKRRRRLARRQRNSRSSVSPGESRPLNGVERGHRSGSRSIAIRHAPNAQAQPMVRRLSLPHGRRPSRARGLPRSRRHRWVDHRLHPKALRRHRRRTRVAHGAGPTRPALDQEEQRRARQYAEPFGASGAIAGYFC